MAIIIDGSTGGYTGPGIPDVTRSNAQKQPDTNNFLNTSYFKLVLGRLPTMTYMCQTVNLPGISIGVADQFTALGLRQKRAGDTYNFDDLTVSFLVDENMDNWTEMFNWMISIADYESNIPIGKGGDVIDEGDHFSDARILITNSAFKAKKEIILKDIIPTNLSGVEFSSVESDSIPTIATATFAFTSMRIVDHPSQQPGNIVNLFTPPER
tara:strand:+ start:264 stop:896 length:633 start_codon:yes stop_codon:yes gene_type:complete